jgi:hypothetical protein
MQVAAGRALAGTKLLRFPEFSGYKTPSYKTPSKTRIRRMMRIVPRPPAGYNPHPALYGQVGRAPMSSMMTIMRRIRRIGPLPDCPARLGLPRTRLLAEAFPEWMV